MSNAKLISSGGGEDVAVNKRYERLLALRTKAVKGKGACNCKARVRSLRFCLVRQVDAAFDLLADWFFEVCGSVTFSSLEHPKFTAFLKQVGMPEVSRRELLCSRLDSKFEEARRASEARIRMQLSFRLLLMDGRAKFALKGTSVLSNLWLTFLMEPESSKRWSARTVKQCHRSMPRRSCGRPLDIFVVAMHIDVFRDSVVRNSFLKFRLQGVEVPAFITVPTTKRDISKNSVACLEDLAAAEVAGVVQDVGFWNEVEAAHSLIKLLISMAEEVEAERPLVGRCLPLWEQMRSKIKEWCTKCNVAEGLQFQLKQQDPVTGKMKIAHPQSSRLVWETCLKEFKSLSKVAVRLLFLQATSSGIKWDWSFTRLFGGQGASRLGFDKVQKLIFVAAHAKLERQDFSSVEENDAELLRSVNGEDEMLNEFTCTDYCELLHVDCENALCEQTAKLSRGCHHQCVRPIHEIDVATRL
ncbi:hypothetical protein SASPL_155993 [Salvia splendens]|uniref:Uncharacterized protein n=1 Tax=Salvia splendens TaxID=180675 RepID=A0A8X8YYG8_SALSN|nr:hypothetical protein SASPL_155993 [Salvia splendens]